MFMKIWVRHDQGGAIGLAFKFFDLVFNVVSVFWVVAELGVVRTYARTSNVTKLLGQTRSNKTNNQTTYENKLLFK